MTIIEKDLSYKLVGLFIELSQKYGHLYKEEIYHNALKELLEREQIKHISQPRINIHSLETSKVLSTYVPDFLIEDKIIIEIKAHPYLNSDFMFQLDQYLKASKFELGILVNFGEPKANIVRRIFTNDRKLWLNKK